MLSSRYFKRLGLQQEELDPLPTLKKLQTICEAHLQEIPFENLSQHGLDQPASLHVPDIANKILDKHRGGFCFELNGLLAAFLQELNYDVARVIAHVYKDDEKDYIADATHVFTMATIDGNKFLVDVGFGEPPIHPVLYELNGTPQRTPEGMLSRFVEINDDFVALEWWQNGRFVPRYKFQASDALSNEGPSLNDFTDNLSKVHHSDSIFEQKVIACRLTRTEKKTLAGSRLKVTGPPRFTNENSVVVKELDGVDEVRSVLESEFGIPLEQTRGLMLDRSLAAPPEIWTHL